MLAHMSRDKNENSSVSEFLKRVKEIRDDWWAKDKDDPWMTWFRGHQRAGWKLCPEVDRDYEPRRLKKLLIEDEMREDFVGRSPALSQIRPADHPDRYWYFLLQLSGTP